MKNVVCFAGFAENVHQLIVVGAVANIGASEGFEVSLFHAGEVFVELPKEILSISVTECNAEAKTNDAFDLCFDAGV